MSSFFESLVQRLADTWNGVDKRRTRPSRSYRCVCERPVFFRNSRCLGCQTPLGYLPGTGKIHALAPGGAAGRWKIAGTKDVPAAEFMRCGNFDSPAGCNWLVPAGSTEPLCVACRLNRTIPNLALPENAVLWARLEAAKRRLVAQLLELGLPVRSRVSEDPEHGLMFDFLRSPACGPRVLTGHDGGLVTINIEEADDAMRERMRNELREPYRTLLGHCRHEVGHYYWDRLIAGTPWHAPFRAVFGDERADYAAALKRNYESGPPPDWPDRHVSSYASVHPWEDWAETWAHYLHLVDTLNTALGFGLAGNDVEFDAEPFTHDALYDRAAPDADRFLSLLNSWIQLTAVLNELNRSMGQPDLYPFVLSKPAVRKLQFIHRVVADANQQAKAE